MRISRIKSPRYRAFTRTPLQSLPGSFPLGSHCNSAPFGRVIIMNSWTNEFPQIRAFYDGKAFALYSHHAQLNCSSHGRRKIPGTERANTSRALVRKKHLASNSIELTRFFLSSSRSVYVRGQCFLDWGSPGG